jgi:ABC-type multidrug transport system fused ATPase/permease subunit
MGLRPRITDQIETDANQVAETIFEPRLRELGLGTDQITDQTLEELQDSLERVNDALKNPQSFGEVNVKITAEAGVLLVARSSTESHQTLGILPLLLDRKRLILARIRELGGRSAEELLERLAAGDTGSEVAAKEAAEALEQLRTARSAGRQSAELDREVIRRRELVEISERRAKVWQSFLARESVASIAGGLLLVALALSLVIAMFVGTETTDVVTNAFLIILGYFFGQSATRGREGSREMS